MGGVTLNYKNYLLRPRMLSKYGKVEIKCKLEGQKGAWPAIWMMPEPPAPRWPHGGEIGRVRSGKYNRKGQTAQDEGGDFLADSAPRRDGSHGLNSGSLGSALNIAFAFCIAKAARLAPCGLRWPVIQTTRQKEGHALMIPKMSGASRIIDAST